MKQSGYVKQKGARNGGEGFHEMDLKRMLRDRKFYLAVLLSFLGILAGTKWPQTEKKTVFEAGTFLSMTTDSLGSQAVLFLLPVTAVLPYGDEYLRERQGRFQRFLLVRRGKREYCLDKVFTTALSGALVWVLAITTGTLFFFWLYFAREAVWNRPTERIWELLGLTGRVCLIASALASFSAVCAIAGGSVYLAFGLPFVAFYSCVILRDRYLEKLYCMDPAEWIGAKQDWGEGKLGLWLFLLLLAAGLAALHALMLGHALKEI